MATGTTTNLGLTTVETGDRLPEAVSKTNFETIDSYVAARALTNKSGATVAANSVVVVDTTADSAFTTTTTASVSKVAGVTQASIIANASGIVKQFGVSSVLVTGTTSRGDWLTTSTTAGRAVAVTQTTPPEGAFALALSATVGAGTVTALLLSVASQAGGQLPTATSPSQTTDGAAVWDSNDNLLTIGDGASRQTFYPDRQMVLRASSDTPVEINSTTTADIIVASGLSIPVTSKIIIDYCFSKDADAATATRLGLKLNSTVVIDDPSGSGNSATQQIEHGYAHIEIAPRPFADAPGGLLGWSVSYITASGVVASAPAVLIAGGLMPIVPITSITINGRNVTTDNDLTVEWYRIWEVI